MVISTDSGMTVSELPYVVLYLEAEKPDGASTETSPTAHPDDTTPSCVKAPVQALPELPWKSHPTNLPAISGNPAGI